MASDVRSAQAPAAARPRRRLRNYLLDPRFQLKYTLMVIAVTAAVASVLGYFAYRFSHGQTEALTVQLAMQEGFDEEAAAQLERMAEEQDRAVLRAIVGGVLALTLALALTGIVITHRVVGPAYKFKRLFSEVARGPLRVQGGLRKHDELKDVFDAFRDMVDTLRGRQESYVQQARQLLAQAREQQLPAEFVEALERLVKALEAPLAAESPEPPQGTARCGTVSSKASGPGVRSQKAPG